MRNIIIPMLVLAVRTTSLPAQVTREQADVIVWEHIHNEVTPPYLLYVNINAPTDEGIAITTSQEESMQAKYACWAYYLDEKPDVNGPSQHRYLFVKEDDGNLLEVITGNDLGPADLTEWTEVTITGIGEMQNHVMVYPNPTGDKLQVTSYELQVMGVEIFDVLGRSVVGTTPAVAPVETQCIASLHSQISNLKPQITINISHLPAGTYFVRITTETGTITRKIIKK